MLYLTDPMARYKSRHIAQSDPLNEFEVIGYIAAGTYGRVYKARTKPTEGPGAAKLVAIKKFKTEKEGEHTNYTGLSQSAYRELGLCRELEHPNIVGLVTTILHDKAIYLVFDYAEHDLLQLIQYHYSTAQMGSRPGIHNVDGRAGSVSAVGSPSTVSKRLALNLIKSVLYQVCEGLAYLHENWVLHRDLKPANIMISAQGRVKIGDLGLARVFHEPLQSLYAGDKVVVTVWYRAPELLLGSRHYTPAIDTWAVGCIFAEMLSLRPMFKGEETTAVGEKGVSNFQRDQVDKVTKILGMPTPQQWPALPATPEYRHLSTLPQHKWCLDEWHRHYDPQNPQSLSLLQRFFDYNPDERISAIGALSHPYFSESNEPRFNKTNCFADQPVIYPARRVATSDANMAVPPAKRSQQQTVERTKKTRR